jgi:hypothetical protein
MYEVVVVVVVVGLCRVRDGNSEQLVYFLKAKQGYTFRKMEEGKWI